MMVVSRERSFVHPFSWVEASSSGSAAASSGVAACRRPLGLPDAAREQHVCFRRPRFGCERCTTASLAPALQTAHYDGRCGPPLGQTRLRWPCRPQKPPSRAPAPRCRPRGRRHAVCTSRQGCSPSLLLLQLLHRAATVPAAVQPPPGRLRLHSQAITGRVQGSPATWRLALRAAPAPARRRHSWTRCCGLRAAAGGQRLLRSRWDRRRSSTSRTPPSTSLAPWQPSRRPAGLLQRSRLVR